MTRWLPSKFRAGLAATLAVGAIMLAPAAAYAYFAVGWYPTSYFDDRRDFLDHCSNGELHQASLPNGIIFGSCTLFDSAGDQSYGFMNAVYPNTIAVSGSSGYVNPMGAVSRVFSAVVTRNVTPQSNSQSYTGAVWNYPNACGDRSQFRLVYNSVANFTTGSTIQC